MKGLAFHSLIELENLTWKVNIEELHRNDIAFNPITANIAEYTLKNWGKISKHNQNDKCHTKWFKLTQNWINLSHTS